MFRLVKGEEGAPKKTDTGARAPHVLGPDIRAAEAMTCPQRQGPALLCFPNNKQVGRSISAVEAATAACQSTLHDTHEFAATPGRDM